MRYSIRHHTWHFFVYRCPMARSELDLRCPIGGITCRECDEAGGIDIAFRRAYQRFPVKPGELLVVVRATDRESKRQAWLMERSWLRELAEFEELMTVGG